MKSLFLTLLISFVLSSFVAARDQYDISKNALVEELESEFSDRTYDLIITLPPGYNKNPDLVYPVLYYTDAQWDTSLVSSIVGKLNYDRSLLPIILVGISYTGADAAYEELRMADLPPSVDESYQWETGNADSFLEFIEKGVIPHIEKGYRADPNERALGGISLGGLFSLYAMYEKPELFKRFISISPAVLWDDEFMFNYDAQFSAEKSRLKARLFLSYGSAEYFLYSDPIKAFQELLVTNDYEGLELLNWVMEGERHGGVAVEGWARGLRWAFGDITPDRPGPLEEYLKGRGGDSSE